VVFHHAADLSVQGALLGADVFKTYVVQLCEEGGAAQKGQDENDIYGQAIQGKYEKK
jgi:hypothetical protein